MQIAVCLCGDVWFSVPYREGGRFEPGPAVPVPGGRRRRGYPTVDDPKIDSLLFAIKRPYSYRIKQLLIESNNLLLDRLTIRERPDKLTFRYWQEGPGYDRNLRTETAVLATIEYIHMNPVRRGLVKRASDWKWSSARWYESDGKVIDPDFPTIHGLPWSFFTDTGPTR